MARGIDPLDPTDPIKDPLRAADPMFLSDFELDTVTRAEHFDPLKTEYARSAEMEKTQRRLRREKEEMAAARQDSLLNSNGQDESSESLPQIKQCCDYCRGPKDDEIGRMNVCNRDKCRSKGIADLVDSITE